MRFITLTLISIVAVFGFSCMAQEMPDSVCIVDSINVDGSAIRVSMSEQLRQRVEYGAKTVIENENKSESTTKTGRQAGYRIQVFSDNNIRTAKSNAEYRKRSIEQRFPGTHAYISFESPYWRVRVGDYKTYAEAENAMSELRAAFPSYAGDMKIIKGRINASH